MKKNNIIKFMISGIAVMCFLSSDVQAARHSSSKTRKKVVSTHKFRGVTAQSAILLDSRGKKLYQKNIQKRVPPASTTKVMTALLVLEHLPLDSVVTVSPRATNVQPSKLNLQAGEQYKVSDLLYGILINSANDASIVLAEAVSGSEEEFVKLMNRRAKQLGASNTRFVNSNGLPSPRNSQYTTAYDMALIFEKALKYDFFRAVIQHPNKTIYSVGGRKLGLKSHNKMLFSSWGSHIYGKTGYTKAAQSCFVGYTMKQDKIIIVGVFGCTKRWDDIRYIIERYGGVSL